MKKFDSLQVDTLNVIDIMSLTDEEIDREIHQIDINQEIIIPNIEPPSLFSDVEDEDEEQLDSLGNKRQNKLNRQRKSLNQTKMRNCDGVLMETSLMIINPSSMESPPPPPPFSPPPLTPTSPPPPLPLSPNIVTTYHTVPSTLTFTLPLTSTTTSPTRTRTEPSSSHQHDENHRHIHSHSHSHHHNNHKHRHSTAVTGESSTNNHQHHHQQHHHQHHNQHSNQHSNHHSNHHQSIQQPTESEIVLSPSKLGQY